MIDHQIEQEMILRDEVSDEAVEAAALVTVEGFQLFRILIASLVRAVQLRSYSIGTQKFGGVLGNRLRFI